MDNKKFQEHINNLVYTSIEDARSSLAFYKHKDIDILRAALVAARKKKLKTLAHMLESRIKRFEKEIARKEAGNAA